MKEKPLQVLLVEDNAGDARLIREMFINERPDSFELTPRPSLRKEERTSCFWTWDCRMGMVSILSGERTQQPQVSR
jgi:hypothetical protein